MTRIAYALPQDPDAGYVLRCPGVSGYRHGLSANQVHHHGCCKAFTSLSQDQQAIAGMHIPRADLDADVLASIGSS